MFEDFEVGENESESEAANFDLGTDHNAFIAESDTSEVVRSCVCSGSIASRDCIMCDSTNC